MGHGFLEEFACERKPIFVVFVILTFGSCDINSYDNFWSGFVPSDRCF